MHFIKKNIIIPLVVFIIGMSAVAGIVCSINNAQPWWRGKGALW